MEANTVNIDWKALLPILLSVAAPMITGFLQQFNKTFSEKGPWWAKTVVTGVIGTLLTMLGNYAANAETSLLTGAIVGTIGSLNIALRKGAGRYFNIELQPPSAPAQPTKVPE